MKNPHRIVIVGGGAGGLELATKLGNTLGKKQLAAITLVDTNLTHIWKPLWHEVAAGTLTSGEDELNYIVHAYNHHFKFQLGSLSGIDRANKKIILSAAVNQHDEKILPQRTFVYDTLIIAIGSTSNDFEVPGVKDNCFFLDNYNDCELFHQQFLRLLIQLQDKIKPNLSIAIVGGGATGVELAAELQFACKQALQYKHSSPYQLHNIYISIIENSSRILSALPEKISQVTSGELKKCSIQVYVNERVNKVEKKIIHTESGLSLNTDLILWAAGIKAPDILTTLGLEVNSKQQLVVKSTLQTTLDNDIFAFGDCANCPQLDSNEPVPPRAQAAHQQAMLLAESLTRHLQNKTLVPYFYHDYGALITLGQYNTLGNLMGNLLGNVMLEGWLAKMAYRFLYRKHQAALYGWLRVILLIFAEFLTQSIRPRLKLH